MKTTIDGIQIEGTPTEIAELIATMRLSASKRAATPAPSKLEDEHIATVEQDVITEQFAYRALRRIPLSTAQKALLQTLKRASPKWVHSSAIQEALNCSPTSLGGIMGGLGRRVSATSGYRAGFSLWEWKWDEDEGQYAYRIPPTVVAALDRFDP